jgi:hypothetical protein
MDACEQYPSIHGHRHFVAGSTRLFVRIQSRVPGFSFSRRMRSLVAAARFSGFGGICWSEEGSGSGAAVAEEVATGGLARGHHRFNRAAALNFDPTICAIVC